MAPTRVFMNPPYEPRLIGRFVDKLLLEYGTHHVAEAIVLVNNATETKWFQALLGVAAAVCFPASRIRFWHPEKQSTPLQGQAIFYSGPQRDLFVSHFRAFGKVCFAIPD